jgi:hypothetical protein
MSEWLGLHNPAAHKDYTGCRACKERCAPDKPCYCCLAAEVEALRESLAKWSSGKGDRQCVKYREPMCECCYDAHRLRAQVAAVREAIAEHIGRYMWECPCCQAVHDALDGDGEW